MANEIEIGEPAPLQPSSFGIEWTEGLYAEYLHRISRIEERERAEMGRVLAAVTKKFMLEKAPIAAALFQEEAAKPKAERL